ncbi:hypothetical protein AC579_8183 [Pseudocercospora musae]|uniref:Uncharacterized protein n=1 Tax=Pseudocercospora musae TaxID=113226 RepID=A0A139IUK5_9PEZI|nr:hypothetical protein AC579_8183 [Pseudocercospora musae]
MPKEHLGNDEFFVQVTSLIEKTQQDGHGSVFLTQKRLTFGTSASSPPPGQKLADDPLWDLNPPNPLPIIIRATDGKSQSKDRVENKDKIKLSTIVQSDDLDSFFARYAEPLETNQYEEACGVTTLDHRRCGRSRCKPGHGTIGGWHGMVFLESIMLYIDQTCRRTIAKAHPSRLLFIWPGHMARCSSDHSMLETFENSSEGAQSSARDWRSILAPGAAHASCRPIDLFSSNLRACLSTPMVDEDHESTVQWPVLRYTTHAPRAWPTSPIQKLLLYHEHDSFPHYQALRNQIQLAIMPLLSGPIDFGSKRSEQRTLKRKAEDQDSRTGTNKNKDRKIARLKKVPTVAQQYGLDLDHEDFQDIAGDILENDLSAEANDRMELLAQVGYEDDMDEALGADLFGDDPDIQAAKAKLLAVKQKETKRTQHECNKILENLRQPPKHFSYTDNDAVQPVKKPIGLALPPKLDASNNASIVKHESGSSIISDQDSASDVIPPVKFAVKATTNKDPRLVNHDYFAASDVLGIRPETVSSANSILSGYNGRIAKPVPSGALLPNPNEVWKKNDAKRREEAKNFIPPPHYAPYQMSEDPNLRRYDLQNNSKEIPFNKEIVHANKNGNLDHYGLDVLKAWLRVQGQPTTGTKLHIEGAIDIFLSEYGSQLNEKYGTAEMAEKKYAAKKAKVETKQEPATKRTVSSPPTMTSTPPAAFLAAPLPTASVERSRPPPATVEDAVRANNAAKWDQPIRTIPSSAKAGTPSPKAVIQAIQRNKLGSYNAPALREFARFVIGARESTSKDKKEQSINHIMMWYGYIKKKDWFAEVHGGEVCHGPVASNGRSQTGVTAGGYRPKSPGLGDGGVSAQAPIVLD